MAGEAESTGLAIPPASPVTGREWALAVCLFLVANYSALSVLDSWLAPWEVVPSGSWFVTTIGYRLLIAVTGACVRPRPVGVAIAATALMWLALDLLSWTEWFDIHTLFAPKPAIHFEF